MKLAEQLQVQLDDELTYYYTHVLKLENMATRLYKVHNLLTGIEVNNLGKTIMTICLENCQGP